MNTGRIIQSVCVNVPPTADPRCSDPAFALLNPTICPAGLSPRLTIKPGFSIACLLGSVQFRAFYEANGTEVDVTDDTIFTSSNEDVALVGAISGNATGLTAGTAEISGAYTPAGGTLLTGMATFTVMGGSGTCCDEEPVSMFLVVDNSRSMGQAFSGTYSTKLVFAKAAATRFISELNVVKDEIGLERFNEADTTVLSTLTSDVALLTAQVAAIPQTQQSTAFYDALVTAISQLTGVAGLRVIVLISDGEDQTPAYDSTNNPIALLSDFKAAGGIVICLGTRASGIGYNFLNLLATGGFFINGYGADEAAALDYLSGLKGYICAGNCVPEGNDLENKGALNYTGFINFDVVDGTTVDLQGNGFFDFLPGHGLYVDLAGTNPDRNGHMVTKVGIPITKNATYRLSVDLSGNQRQNFSPNSVLLRVFYLSGATEVDVLGTSGQSVVITDYTQDFETFAFTFVAPVTESVFLSIQQQAVPADQDERIGLMLDRVKFEELAGPGEALLSAGASVLFDDNFDDENPVYVPPKCGPGMYGTYGYNCYGTGCLDSPPIAQLPDPAPLPDIEAGYPPPHEYSATRTKCATCPPGSGNTDQTDLIPAMTSDTSPSGVAFASLEPGLPYDAWSAFDGNNATFWTPPASTGYIGYQFPAAVIVTGYSIRARGDLGATAPTDWTFEGSNNGSTWNILGTQSGLSFFDGERKVFTVTNATAYTYYRVNVSANGTGNLAIAEIEMFSGSAPAEVCKTASATSENSQQEANDLADAAALALATAELDCRPLYTSTVQATATCPTGTFGGPFTASATRTSRNSQDEALHDATVAAQAAADALRDADCSGSNNTQRIVINDNAPATPYPSVQHVDVADGIVITTATVTLTGFRHSWPEDAQILLVSPAGTKVALMQNCGGSIAVPSPINLVFADSAGSMLPDATLITAGTYKPSQYGLAAAFPAPAPGTPYQTTLAAVAGENSAGSWALWVQDNKSFDSGEIVNGWSISFT